MSFIACYGIINILYSYNWNLLFSEVGQNLYVNYNEKDATAPIDAWWAEISYYDYDDDSCTPGKQCGHYKQVPEFFISFCNVFKKK